MVEGRVCCPASGLSLPLFFWSCHGWSFEFSLSGCQARLLISIRTDCCANSSCGSSSFLGRREPAAGARMCLRHCSSDHQVPPLLVVLEGALRQRSACYSSKFPGRRVWGRKWRRGRWVRWSLCCLRELLLLLSSGVYDFMASVMIISVRYSFLSQTGYWRS